MLGHEFCAEVVDFGPDTERSLAVGQLVCSVPVVPRSQPEAIGYSDQLPGGFGEYMVLAERLLIPVPAGTPATAAALTEPMAVGYHAVNKANLEGGEGALVIGAGPVGLAVITALKARGVGPIVATDFSPGRRRFALAQGADAALNPNEDDPFALAEVRDRDTVIFECVGVPGMLDHLFINAKPDSRIVVVGVCLQTDHIRPLIAVNKELSLQFVLGYSLAEFADSLSFISDGKFDVANLVSHTIGLDDVAVTFEALKDPDKYAKVVVQPWG